MNLWRTIVFVLYSLVACLLKVFVSNHNRRSLDYDDHPLWNTTQFTTSYQRPSTLPQIRLDWLEKFGLIKRTSTTATFTRPRV
jgi:hypothetical protein